MATESMAALVMSCLSAGFIIGAIFSAWVFCRLDKQEE